MNTFPTWHRPYVALYEQLLASLFPGIVQDYAASNPDLGQRLNDASKIWRLPYWDWGIDSDIPDEWSNVSIDIYDSKGGVVSVSNPLNHYTFHPIDSSFRPFRNPNYAGWRMTLRSPNSSTNPNAQSRPAISNARLASNDFRQWILDLFPEVLFQPDPWGQFSNHTWNFIHRNQGTLTSLEGIHDQVHVDVGGNGHMSDPAVAAFDPIFWFHHCQVDRLLNLWQTAYPDVYVSPGPDLTGIHPIQVF